MVELALNPTRPDAICCRHSPVPLNVLLRNTYCSSIHYISWYLQYSTISSHLRSTSCGTGPHLLEMCKVSSGVACNLTHVLTYEWSNLDRIALHKFPFKCMLRNPWSLVNWWDKLTCYNRSWYLQSLSICYWACSHHHVTTISFQHSSGNLYT